MRLIFTYTGVSPPLNSVTTIVTCIIARRYRRITGLGFGKHAHDVAYDDVETVSGTGPRPSAATSLTTSA
ncbi:MAG: hypothetical protein ACFFCD_02335 [Promethearchaeota archaeon]